MLQHLGQFIGSHSNRRQQIWSTDITDELRVAREHSIRNRLAGLQVIDE